LDATVKANFHTEAKTGHGALAPVNWQRGFIGDVIDYCLMDVRLTLRVLRLILDWGHVVSPKDPTKVLKVNADMFVQPEQKDLF
jgi:hypothetical protein